MTDQPLVAVVTVNWNTASESLQCVGSVLQSDYSNLRVLVVDNGSRPEELELLRSGLPEGAQLLPLDANYGYVGGINRGLHQAKQLSPVYFLVMNNDTVLDPAAVSELVAAARRHQDKCIVTGIVYDYHEPDLIQQCGSHYRDRRRLIFKPFCSNKKDPGFSGDDVRMDMIDDVFWLLPLKVHDQVGDYCDYFWFNDEQADYALRAVEKGFQLVFTPKARIWHKGSVSIGGRKANPVREYFDTKSRLILRYRHMSRLRFLAYQTSTFMNLTFHLIKHVVKSVLGQPARVEVAVARIVGFCYFVSWRVHKKPDQGQVPKFLGAYR